MAESGAVRAAGRVATRVESLELFAASLVAGDVVAVEATTGTDKIVSVLERHGIRVVVANTRKLRAISEAKAKTDRLDARTLARLLMSGLLDEVWTPDERTRMLRRLTNRRERIVRARSRAKNEAQAVLARNLCERPPVTDAFGKAGRCWLAELDLPVDERLTLDGCLRQVDFLDTEVAALDAEIAKQALAWPEVLRLMTVPGVNVQTAATFMASIGDISRFPSPRKLVSYLGLDPRVRQSGNGPARHGRISKEGASETRHMLGEVAWKVMMTPGPLRAFFERVRARRGPQVAATATARKLAVLFWHMLTRGEGLRVRPPRDDPQQDPPPRAARRRPTPEGPQGNRRQQISARLRRRTRTLPASRTGLPTAGQRLASNTTESGCGRDKGARISKALEGQSRATDSLKPQGLLFAPSVTRTRSAPSQKRARTSRRT